LEPEAEAEAASSLSLPLLSPPPPLPRVAPAAAEASGFSRAPATAAAVEASFPEESLLAGAASELPPLWSPRAPVAIEARNAAASAAESEPGGDERSLRGASVAVFYFFVAREKEEIGRVSLLFLFAIGRRTRTHAREARESGGGRGRRGGG